MEINLKQSSNFRNYINKTKFSIHFRQNNLKEISKLLIYIDKIFKLRIKFFNLLRFIFS